MAKKKEKHIDTSPENTVVFSLNAPGADTVLILGDFNGWDQKNGGMKKNQKGVWKKSFSLSPGTYQYKFLVDGDWRLDPECGELVTNVYGTLNSVISV
ncbi:MAG TPA: glycogen-binding domain-containing protein [bacterium]|nr:glycogen-binding domain-containing protein [bacterium]